MPTRCAIAEAESELADGTPLAAETARRLACDAAIVPLIERAGRPLSVGRKTRSIPPALRRALSSRDRGCRFPGCTNHRTVDAHHIEHWANGGATSLENLVQLCRHHHRLLHEGGYSVTKAGAGFVFRRPDGREIRPIPRPPRGCSPHPARDERSRRPPDRPRGVRDALGRRTPRPRAERRRAADLRATGSARHLADASERQPVGAHRHRHVDPLVGVDPAVELVDRPRVLGLGCEDPPTQRACCRAGSARPVACARARARSTPDSRACRRR